MRSRHVGGDVREAAGSMAPASRQRQRRAGLLAGALLALPLTACANEEPSTEPPDPGAPITRSPS